MQASYDVAIIGLGPVGAMAAILFANAGLRVVCVERDKEVYRLPRAVNLDGEIVRAMQPVGLAAQLDALLQKKREGDWTGFGNSKREPLFGAEVRDFGANGWQPMNMFHQPEVEGFLREHACAMADTYIGWEAQRLTEDDEAATVDIRSLETGTVQRLRASFVVACDGASSFVRRELGIGWCDLGYDHDWLVVDVRVEGDHQLSNQVLQVCDPKRLSTYVCTKDPFRRWEFKLLPGEAWEEMQQPQRIAELIDEWTPRGTYEVVRAAVYQFHAGTAAEWRRGRVLLAGDAAHQMPPFLGQGMNSGMRDVINLAWKLPLVVNGVCEADLLDSYFAERNGHAADLVEWAVSVGKLMEHLASAEEAVTQGRSPPQTPPQLRSSGYGQGREQPPLREGVLLADQVDDDVGTGYLFSQPLLEDGSRLDDLLGSGFVLVGMDDSALTLNQTSLATLEALGGKVVSLPALKVARGRLDRALQQSNAVLVRPDRTIFGVTSSEISADDLISVARRTLHMKDQ